MVVHLAALFLRAVFKPEPVAVGYLFMLAFLSLRTQSETHPLILKVRSILMVLMSVMDMQ